MRPECRASVEAAIGRELAPGEDVFIDKQITAQLREDARENPGRFKVTNRAQRLRVAGARAAQKIARGQAVTDWTDQDQDELERTIREELVKAGANVRAELEEGRETTATYFPAENIIRFALNAIEGKSVKDALAGFQGVISHELIHWARSQGIIDDAHWTELTAAASQLHFRRKDAERVGVLDAWLTLNKSKKNPTYQDFADYMYDDLDEQGRQEEAVAAAIEVEATRRAAELSSQGSAIARALGALLRAGRAVLRGIARLTSPQQASLRAQFRATEGQLRKGELAKNQYRQTVLETTNPIKVGKISDEVLDAIPQEEIDDLIARLENPLAQPAEIMDAPFFESLRALEGDTTITGAEANRILKGPANDELKAKFFSYAGKKGPKKAFKAVILTGAPGAGKTSIAGEIAKTTRSAYLSADLANETLYGGGIKSNSNYASAKAEMERATYDILPEGNNVVIERIGDDLEALRTQIALLRHLGYSVDIVHIRSDFSNRVRGAAVRALATGRWPSTADQIRIGNAPTSVHKTVKRLRMGNGDYEVRLGKDGKYNVLNRGGKPSAALSRAITAAAGGGVARIGQALTGANAAEPREYSLAFARLFREQQRRWGVEPEHRPMDNFAGRRAKGANLTALGIAQQMDKEGVDKNTIKRQTGWFKTGVKNWQYIPPSGKVTLKPAFYEAEEHAIRKASGGVAYGQLGDFIESPVLEDYPALKRVPVKIEPLLDGAGIGSRGTLTIGHGRSLGVSTEQLIAHELQHLVSAIEKFERGGNPDSIFAALRLGRWKDAPQWAIDETAEKYPDLKDHPTIFQSMALYEALRDELRARYAEEMESMSPEERANFDVGRLMDDSQTIENQSDITGNPLLLAIKSIPLKFLAKWSVVAGTAGYSTFELANFLANYFTQNAVSPESIRRLEGVIAEGKEVQQQEAPQEFRLKKAQATKFLDFATKYKPVKRAMEAAGIDGAPTAFTRDQFIRLRRALFDITDLSFLEDMGPLTRRYGMGKANQQFRAFESDRKAFAAFLENGVMDGGFVPASSRKKSRKIDTGSGLLIENPSASDLYLLTKPVEGQNRKSIRYVRDGENVYVANSWDKIHAGIVADVADHWNPGVASRAEMNTIVNLRSMHGDAVAQFSDSQLLKAWDEFSMSEDYGQDEKFLSWLPEAGDGGRRIIFGEIQRVGNKFVPVGAYSSVDHVVENFRPMDARKSKAYNAPGGKKGVNTSTTSFTHIPHQPGYEDLVNRLRADMAAVPTKQFLGQTIQDKTPKGTYKLLFGAGKWLDAIDHDIEQFLKAKWGGLFSKLPVVNKMIQSYFPFGGVPDNVALQVLRSQAAGRASKAADTATRVAGDLKAEIERAAGKGKDRNEQIADIMENVRKAMVEPNSHIQAYYINNLPHGVRQATVDAIATIDEVGEALVENQVLHPNQQQKYAGHYLRRAYAKYLTSYMPSSGTRASGANYRRMRDTGMPEDVRLTKGEIKYVPFLVYLSIEEPLRDLAMYGYWNSLMHYAATAPNDPGWFLPNTTVMWGGKFRTLFWLAQEREQNQVSLNAKRVELANIGGNRATSAIAQELKREIRVLANTQLAMDAYLGTNPQYARAIARGDLPDGYEQLPGDTAKFGDAAGAIVLKQLYDDAMVGLDRSGTDKVENIAQKMWSTFNRNQKFLLTVANPATHFRNIYSNVMMLARSGANPVEALVAVAELREYYKNGNASRGVQTLLDNGQAKQTLTEAELRQMDQFASRVARLEKRAKLREGIQNAVGPGDTAERILSVMDVAGALAFGWKNAYSDSMSFLYNMEDALFKLAKINDEMKRGTPPSLAALEARKFFFDYSNVPPVIRWLRNSPFAPFISFSYFALPNAIEQMATSPWRLAYTSYVWPIIAGAMFAAMAGYEPEEGQKVMSENMRERMLLPIPLRDEYGRTIWFDGIYLLPEGAAVSAVAAANRGDLMGIFQGVGVAGGPIVNTGIGLVTGYDPFRGTEIWEETDDEVTRGLKGYAFAVRQFIPSTYAYYVPPFPGEQFGAPGFEAVWGTGTDRYGEPGPNEFQLAARAVGLNTYTSDFGYDLIKRLREYDYRLNDLTQDLRRAYTDQRLDPERRLARVQYLRDRIKYLLDRRDRLMSETANAAYMESQRNQVTSQ